MTDPNVKHAWWLLRMTFGLVPIIAGLDKFTNLLVDWKQYMSPAALDVIGASHAQRFMYGVGVIEILAGIIVLSPWTRIGAYVVSAWLFCIACNVVLARHYDVAVRDLVMSVGAFTLGQLSAARAVARVPVRRYEPAPA